MKILSGISKSLFLFCGDEGTCLFWRRFCVFYRVREEGSKYMTSLLLLEKSPFNQIPRNKRARNPRNPYLKVIASTDGWRTAQLLTLEPQIGRDDTCWQHVSYLELQQLDLWLHFRKEDLIQFLGNQGQWLPEEGLVTWIVLQRQSRRTLDNMRRIL